VELIIFLITNRFRYCNLIRLLIAENCSTKLRVLSYGCLGSSTGIESGPGGNEMQAAK